MFIVGSATPVHFACAQTNGRGQPLERHLGVLALNDGCHRDRREGDGGTDVV